MNYETYMLLWENTYIKVKEIEYKHQTKATIKQTMKHSAILIITGGKVDLCIGQAPYHVQHFSIFHIGKSELLHIKAWEKYSYYIIYYKGDVIYFDPFIQHLYMEYRPFHTSFSCVPANPIVIELLLQDMYIKWKTGSFQEHLSVKAIFYDIIHRIFLELTKGQGKPHAVDLAESARIYLEQHVHEAITVQKLADSLKISTRHLLRVFKERYGKGPQRYLQQHRIELAKQYLQTDRLSIKEIAAALGYEDEYYFSRAFKKEVQIAPSTYRLKYLANMSDSPITNDNYFHYNKNQLVQAKRLESRENKLMKQTFMNSIKLPFLASLMLLLGACGNEDQQEKTVELAKVETHTVTDLIGREVEIPIGPKRVVTDFYVDMLLALGIEPVGALDYALEPDYIQSKVQGIEKIGFPVNMEKVLELQPDVIVTFNLTDGNLEKFEKIAPTIALPWLSGDLYQTLRELGKLINKEQVAEDWIVSIEQKAEQARQDIQGIIGEDETVSIVVTFGKANPRIYGGRELGHIFYRLLDLKPTPFIVEKMKEDPTYSTFVAEEISLEVLPDFAGDWIIVMDYTGGNNDDGVMLDQIQTSVIWKNLDAVKNDRVIYVPQDPFFSYAPLAIEQSLEQAVQLIKEKAQ